MTSLKCLIMWPLWSTDLSADSIFLEGVIETANQAVKTAQAIIQLFTTDRKKIESLGRPAASALLVHHYLERHTVTDIAKIAAHCNITIPTATKSIKHLEKIGIVKEMTGKARHKIYIYQRYLDILNEEIGDFL